MIASFLAIALSLAAAYVGMLRLRRVAKALSVDPVELARIMGRGAGRRRVAEMARVLRDEGAIWEADLFEAALHESEEARVIAVNEALDDLASALNWGRELPASAAKISILGALCIICAKLAGGDLSARSMLEILAWGGAGAVASLSAGGEAKRMAAAVRKNVDMLVERALVAATKGEDRAFGARAGVDSEPAGV